MVDIIPDGAPVETPEMGAIPAYENIPAPFGQMLGTQAGSTIASFGRVAAQGQYEGSGFFPQLLYGGMNALASAAEIQAGMPEQPMPAAGTVPSPVLSPNDYNERFAPIGNDGKPVSLGSEPMPEGVARLIGKAKHDEIERENVTARFESAHSWPTNFAAGAVGFMLDPLRASTVFVPGIGEEAIAARLGGGIAARISGRLLAGAATGAIAQAPLSALEYGLGTQEASDYGLRQAFRDMAFAAAGNAIIHTGIGTAGELLRGRPPAPISETAGTAEALPRTPEESLAAVPEEAAPILSADAQTQHAAISSAVAQLSDGRPVDVQPFFYRPPQAETAIGLALQSAERVQIITEPTVEEQAQRISPDVFAEYNAISQRRETFRRRLSDLGAMRDQGTSPAIAALDRQINELRGLRLEAQGADRAHMANEVIALEERRRSLVDALPREGDTPEMAFLRSGLLEADYRMRDLAKRVSAATRGAEAIMTVGRANRAVAMGPRFMPAEAVAQQRELQADGFAPGVPQDELREAGASIYAPPKEAEATEPKREALSAPELQATPAAETEADPELVAAQQRATTLMAAMTEPEERVELEAAHEGISLAETRASAYDEAANCLKESGL